MELREVVRTYTVYPKTDNVEELVWDLFWNLAERFEMETLYRPKKEDDSFVIKFRNFENFYNIKIGAKGAEVEISYGELAEPKYEAEDVEKIETVIRRVLEG